MIKKVFLAVFGLVLSIGLLAGLYVMMIRGLIAAGEGGGPPPEAVSIGEVTPATWEATIPAVGSVVAFQGTMVSAETDGVVREIAFEAGATVEVGTLLVKLDSEVEAAQLEAAVAGADLARTNAARARDLFANNTISRAEWDSAEAALKQTDAQVANMRALVAKRAIRAPFTGRLGIRHVNIGQYLNKGASVVSLQTLDPVFVDFTLPQQRLGQIEKGMKVRVTSDAFPGEIFEGALTAINPEIDASTRNMRIQATLGNHDGRLRPGMYVGIAVVAPQKREVLVIPQTAVLFAPYGDSVFIVEQGEAGASGAKALTVRQQFVRTAEKRGDFVEVVSGLKAGARIVTNGAFKLRNGAAVVASDIAVATPSLTPTPEDR